MKNINSVILFLILFPLISYAKSNDQNIDKSYTYSINSHSMFTGDNKQKEQDLTYSNSETFTNIVNIVMVIIFCIFGVIGIIMLFKSRAKKSRAISESSPVKVVDTSNNSNVLEKAPNLLPVDAPKVIEKKQGVYIKCPYCGESIVPKIGKKTSGAGVVIRFICFLIAAVFGYLAYRLTQLAITLPTYYQDSLNIGREIRTYIALAFLFLILAVFASAMKNITKRCCNCSMKLE